MNSVGSLKTPVGRACFVVGEQGLQRLWFESWDRGSSLEEVVARGDCAVEDTSGVCQVRDQLAEYFEGKRQSFDLKLDPKGTEFQKKVWAALLEIPYGVTCSYADIARAVGQPTATRAVGAANGANP